MGTALLSPASTTNAERPRMRTNWPRARHSEREDGSFIFAITKGTLPQEQLLVRVQSACLFGESLGVNSCDCAAQLQQALRIGSEQPHFLLVYLMNQEGRGLGMFQKIKAINAAGTSVLLVEQNARYAFETASRGYVLQTGSVIASGPCAELKLNPRVQEAYLGRIAAVVP